MPSKHLSLFKYPGGKSKLVKEIRQRLDHFIERSQSFHEVFIGGGPVMLDIANDPHFNNVRLFGNDKDPNTFAFWELLSNGSDNDFNRLIDLLNRQPTIQMFWEERAKQTSPDSRDILTKAYHCVFFHKTTFNGMYFASPIGGKNQQGKWKVDSHYKAKNLVNKISEARRRVKGRLQMFSIDICEYLDSLPDGHAFYLDPPYYSVGSTLYSVFMQESEHQKMADQLKTKSNWVLSYDDIPQTNKLYSFANIERIVTWYSSSSFNMKESNKNVDKKGIEKHKCERKSELIITPKPEIVVPSFIVPSVAV